MATPTEPPRNAVMRIRIFIQKGLGNTSRSPGDHNQYMYDAGTGQAHLTLFGRAFAFASPERNEADAKEGVHRAALCRDILHTILKSVPPERIEKFDLERMATEWQSMATLGPLPSKAAAQPNTDTRSASVPSSSFSTGLPSASTSSYQTTTSQGSVVQPTRSQPPASIPPPPYSPHVTSQAYQQFAQAASNPPSVPRYPWLATPAPSTPSTYTSTQTPAQPKSIGVHPILPPKVPTLGSHAIVPPRASMPHANTNAVGPTQASRPPSAPAATATPAAFAFPSRSSHIVAGSSQSTASSHSRLSPPSISILSSTRNGIGLQKDSSGALLSEERSPHKSRELGLPDFHNPDEVKTWQTMLAAATPDNAVDRIRWLSEAHLSRCKKPEVYKPYLDYQLEGDIARLVIARSLNMSCDMKLHPEERYLMQSEAGRAWLKEDLANQAIKKGVLRNYIKMKVPKGSIRHQVDEIIRRYSDMRSLCLNRRPSPPLSPRANGHRQREELSQVSTPARPSESSSMSSTSKSNLPTSVASATTPSSNSRSQTSEPIGLTTHSPTSREPAVKTILGARPPSGSKEDVLAETSRTATSTTQPHLPANEVKSGPRHSQSASNQPRTSPVSTTPDATASAPVTSQDVSMGSSSPPSAHSKAMDTSSEQTIPESQLAPREALLGHASLPRHPGGGTFMPGDGISDDMLPPNLFGQDDLLVVSNLAEKSSSDPRLNAHKRRKSFSQGGNPGAVQASVPPTSPHVAEIPPLTRSPTNAMSELSAPSAEIISEQAQSALREQGETDQENQNAATAIVSKAPLTMLERITEGLGAVSQSQSDGQIGAVPARTTSLSERIAAETQGQHVQSGKSSLLSRLQAEKATVSEQSRRRVTQTPNNEKVSGGSLIDRLSDREAELRRRIGALRRASVPAENREEASYDVDMQVDRMQAAPVNGLPDRQPTKKSVAALAKPEQAWVPSEIAQLPDSSGAALDEARSIVTPANLVASAPQESAANATAVPDINAIPASVTADNARLAATPQRVTDSVSTPAEAITPEETTAPGQTPPPRPSPATSRPLGEKPPPTAATDTINAGTSSNSQPADLAQGVAPVAAQASPAPVPQASTASSAPAAAPLPTAKAPDTSRTTSSNATWDSNESFTRNSQQQEPTAASRPRSGSFHSTYSGVSRAGQEGSYDDLHNKRRRDSAAGSYSTTETNGYRDEGAEAKRRRRDSPPVSADGSRNGVSRLAGKAGLETVAPSDLYTKMQEMTSILAKLACGALSYDQACETLYALRLPPVMDSAAFEALETVWSSSAAQLFEKASTDFGTSDLVLMPKAWVEESMKLLQAHSKSP